VTGNALEEKGLPEGLEEGLLESLLAILITWLAADRPECRPPKPGANLLRIATTVLLLSLLVGLVHKLSHWF